MIFRGTDSVPCSARCSMANMTNDHAWWPFAAFFAQFVGLRQRGSPGLGRAQPRQPHSLLSRSIRSPPRRNTKADNMEVFAAAVGVADVAARSGYKIWKL